MKRKAKVVIGTGILTSAVVGFAFATPIVGLISPLLAVGNQSADLDARGTAAVSNGERFRVELETDGPSTISTQDGAYAAGGQNGWHSHPGMVAVTLISGSITWYDENCQPTNYKAGDSWVEGSKIHAFKVTGTTGIHLMATSSPRRVKRCGLTSRRRPVRPASVSEEHRTPNGARISPLKYRDRLWAPGPQRAE